MSWLNRVQSCTFTFLLYSFAFDYLSTLVQAVDLPNHLIPTT